MRSVASNNYVAFCGATKHINSDDDKILKLWYKLHRKKCSICKDRPYKVNNDVYIDASTTEGHALVDIVKGDAIMAAQDEQCFKKYLRVKDYMTTEQKQKMRELAIMEADKRARFVEENKCLQP